MSETIIVCDDEELVRWSIGDQLEHDGYTVLLVKNGQECLSAVAANAPAAVLMDLKMPVMDGLTALRILRETDKELPVVVMTAHGGVESAIEATRLGAAGYLTKPFDLREARLALERAITEQQTRREVHYLRAREIQGYGEIVGQSPAMLRLFETLRRIERIDAPTVLLQGESGTGKDLVARAIHARGPRKDRPFVEVDCAALPEPLLESELFGHEKGAFTDARATKRGLFEVASGGMLFLDEIGELALGLQAKLLRALENRRFRRVGSVADLPFDAAILAATNRNLKEEVKAGRFREDLYFRLHVVPIDVPSLRERGGDIQLLVEHFVARFSKAFGRPVKGVTHAAMELLNRYPWPGNVRELRNVIERTVILLQGEVIEAGDLPLELRSPPENGGLSQACPFVLPPEGVNVESVERGLVEQALARTGGNQTEAGKLLGLTRFAVHYRIEKFKLQ